MYSIHDAGLLFSSTLAASSKCRSDEPSARTGETRGVYHSPPAVCEPAMTPNPSSQKPVRVRPSKCFSVSPAIPDLPKAMIAR
jgi:hypothetical protein